MTTLALAPEPGRSTASVTVSFGLLSIPVSLYAQHQVTRTARHEYVKAGDEWHPVGRQSYDKVSGDPVDRANVVKMVESDGTLVEVDDAAYAAATGADLLGGRFDVEATIPLDQLWSLFGAEGTVWQVRAKRDKKVGAQAAAERGLALLLAALAEAEVAAIGRTAVRGGEVRLVALTPDGTLHALRTVDQQRAPKPLPSVSLSEAEVAVAVTLIESIGTLDTEAEWLADQGAVEVATRAAAAAKAAKAGEAAVATAVAPTPEAIGPDELLATLTASVEAAKKSRKEAAA